jgi:hypothetical protein
MNINSNVSSIGIQTVQSGSGTSQTIPQASSSADLGSDSSTSGEEQNPAVHQSPPPAGMGQLVDKTV